ncbi:MAG: addiction module protein [Verrucomicrobia bacterium]|nr:addiction module protein [Verrucomicrobiota bacterium]MDA1006021.1 addiction module protein [Verrucomicrobiota bacterium]
MDAAEIRQSAMQFPDDQRAELAADLLSSLAAVLAEPDDGVAEAQRRLEELKADPASGRTWNEIKEELGR